MAAAVFIIIPESLTLITQAAHDEDEEDGHDEDHRYLEEDPHDDHGDEPQGTWKFGVAVLAGFLLPTLLGALFPRAQEHECDDECPPNADSDVKGAMAFAGNSDDEPCSDLCHKEDSDCEICSLTDGNDDKPNDIELNKVQDSHHDHDHSHDHFHDHNSSSLTKAVVASAVLVTDRDSDNDQSKGQYFRYHVFLCDDNGRNIHTNSLTSLAFVVGIL
jgi:ABC-type nickel/cobalt efflux system permease component RcnA